MKKSCFNRFALFLLTFSMVFNLSFTVNAKETGYEEKIDILKMLNIADANLDMESFFPDTKVSRADFAKYISRLMNYNVSGNTALYYNDIPKTHYAYDEITMVTEMGLMSGVGNKVFDPEGIMKTEYALVVFAKIMGCGSITGGSVTESRNICSNLGILKDTKATDGDLTLGNLFTIIYNALFTEYYTMSSDGTIEESEDLLIRVVRKMNYVKRGLVTGAEGVDINGGELQEGIVVIDGIEYNESDFDMEKYLGRYVEFIYIEGGRRDEYVGTVAWVKAVNSDDVLKISVNPDCTYNKITGELEFTDENGKEDKVEIPENISVIYNGKFKETGVKDAFSHERYELTLVEGKSGEYEIAVIWEYKNMAVDYVSITDMVAFGKNSGEKLNLDPDKYEKLEIIGADGAKISASGIKTGDVLSYYETDGRENLKVYVTNNIVSGQVTEIEEGKVTIAGNTYEFYKEDASIASYIGKNVNLYLDLDGYISYFELGTGTSGLMVGFMVKCNYVDDGDEQINFKVFTENSTMEMLKSADKISVNGKNYKGGLKEAVIQINGGVTKSVPQMIAYKKNTDGAIVQVYTAMSDDGGAHTFIENERLAPLEGVSDDVYGWAYYTVGSGQLGRTMAIGANTKVFIVPDDSMVEDADDKYFRIGGLAEGIYEDVISYRTTPEATMFEQYILVRQNSLSDKLSNYGVMFDSAFTALADDGMPVLKVRFVSASGAVNELIVSEDVNFLSFGFKRGDIFKYSTNGVTGEISGVQPICQPALGILNTVGTPTAEFRTAFGYVNEISSDGIRVGYNSGRDFDEVLNMATPGMRSVVVYDRELDEIIAGTYADLKPYSSYGSECSTLVYGTNYKRLVNMFGYR